MREILFKAKRTDNHEWVRGYYVTSGEKAYIICMVEEECVDGENTDLLVTEWYRVDPTTICRYTGKNDENNQKIWENDIVAFIDMTSTENGYWERDCCGQVLWDDEETCFYVTNRLSAESYEVMDGCRVIGNIFEKPELLEE